MIAINCILKVCECGLWEYRLYCMLLLMIWDDTMREKKQNQHEMIFPSSYFHSKRFVLTVDLSNLSIDFLSGELAPFTEGSITASLWHFRIPTSVMKWNKGDMNTSTLIPDSPPEEKAAAELLQVETLNKGMIVSQVGCSRTHEISSHFS